MKGKPSFFILKDLRDTWEGKISSGLNKDVGTVTGCQLKSSGQNQFLS